MKNTENKLSEIFIEKYKYCPTTNSVMHSLNRGAEPIRLLEQVLAMYEDFSKEVYEKEKQIMIYGAPPTIILTTNENMEEVTFDWKISKLFKNLKPVFPFFKF